MSDPVSNSEIEDVLSSIRRLVSEDSRRAEPAPREAKVERLVLTPAQRVEDDASAGDSAAVGEADAPDENVSLWDEDTGGDVEENHDPNPEPDTAEATEPEAASEVEDWGDDAHGEDGAGVAEPDNADESAEAAPRERSGLESKIAELEALIGRSDDAWEPDEAGQDEYAGDPTDVIEWEDASDLAGPETQDQAEPEPFDETEGWSVSEVVEETPTEADRVDPTGVEDAAETDHLDDLFDENTLAIDEAVLRDMLTEIVREELQGALGERITRNVRKLVRREIHRAMTTREFD